MSLTKIFVLAREIWWIDLSKPRLSYENYLCIVQHLKLSLQQEVPRWVSKDLEQALALVLPWPLD
jgi:hypothetical protein